MHNGVKNHHEQLLAELKALAFASLNAWQIDCQDIALIKYRENAVFKVTTTADSLYALRIHRSGYHTDEGLRSELQWMFALQKDGFEVPSVIATSSGDLFIRAALPSTKETVQIDLFEWVDGVHLGTVEQRLGNNIQEIEHTYRSIGSIAAQLHNHSNTWKLPSGFVRHAWDKEGLVGEQPFWGRFLELEVLTNEQRKLLLKASEIVYQELTTMSQSPEFPMSYGLIHGDLVAENLLVSEGKIRLIDFDDAGFGWYLFDIATALYFINEDPNYAIARDALIAEYRQHRPLSDTMLAKLPVLMMARGCTYLSWMHSRKGSEAAKELTPFVTKLACNFAAQFVKNYA